MDQGHPSSISLPSSFPGSRPPLPALFPTMQSDATTRKVQAVTTLDEVKAACASPSHQCAVLKFGAVWCEPCRAVAPQVERWLADEAPACVSVLAADADDAEALLVHYGIRRLPTFLVLRRDGTIAARLQTSDFAKVRIEVTDFLERTSRSASADEF